MDNQINPQVILPQEKTRQKKGLLQGLFLLEVGVIEIGSVTIILGLIFGLINYFHILKFSSNLPILSILPQARELTPTPIPINILNAQSSLKTYIKQTMQTRFLPVSGIDALDIKEINRAFQTFWGSKFDDKIIFHASESYDASKSQLNYQVVSLNTNYPAQGITATDSAKLIKVYYNINSAEIASWNCSHVQNNTSSIICESFTITNTGSIGYTILNLDINKLNTTILSCYVPKQSIFFQRTSSCFSLGL